MAQLRSNILYKRKREDVENSERQYKRIHIAEPIQEYQADEEKNDEFVFNAFNVSDTEELDSDVDDTSENIKNDNTPIINSEQWTKMIDNWIEMVNMEENQLDSENFIGESDERPYDFEVGGHDTHPADNMQAKWKLLDLFDESLEAPVYIGSMINLN
jgi:hypothetical protein